MAEIRVLDKHTAELIAAGEVVGRIRGGEPIPMRLELREGLIVVHTL